MIRIFFPLAMLVIVPELGAQKLPDPVLHSLLSEGIDLTLRQEYGGADSVFRNVAARFPGHPTGYLYQAAVMQTRAMDYEIPFDRRPFDSLLSTGEALANSMIQAAPSSPWGYYFLGTAYGYDAFARSERADWFGAVTKGLSSASQFKTVIEKDSTFFDAYVGVGTYYYWKSRKTEFLSWLPFMTDNSEEGIRMLQACATHGTYNRLAALSALVTIYLDANEFQKSADEARQAIALYPGNRVFLWGLASAQEKLGSAKDALETYEILLRTLERDGFPSPYSEILCRFNMVKLKIKMNDTSGVNRHLEALLSFEHYHFPGDLAPRAQSKFEEARRILATSRTEKASRD